MLPTPRRPGRRADPVVGLLDALADRPVNYDEAAAPPAVTVGWHQDRRVAVLGREAPGEPAADGVFARAVDLVNSYEFSDPAIVRAAYRSPGDLLGRAMVLEGRFLLLRLLMGVRVTDRHDELVEGPEGPERRVGWSYQTLDGHIEQGRLTYEVAKLLDTGRVEFRIIAHSRRAPIANPVLRLGFRVFGRHTQQRFYRNALRRLQVLVREPATAPRPGPDGIVRAPTGSRPGRFEAWTVRLVDAGATPGR
ncbi:DUF1990 family protein [Pseudonocardia sp. WMMC193]|uniref:DUF1990 family protein n=1 Tax=Pseudonocardia sp. WMMC193 TaxID=2911965 RepID=UPI001F41B250|nr:DUF1990 family protein [Pseudonocardia sp. WMMC193]MCF7553027.1 DUF1990 domain-containing protein [Pseudonocardia sp. WMMC193]